MKKQIEIKQEKKLAQIKRLMKLYHSAFDRSLKFRSIMEAFKDERYERRLYFEKMTDAEIRCIELDEKIGILIGELQLLKLQ